jgi:phosphoglycolate phosphatase-like HAD superfamily hydrolase
MSLTLVSFDIDGTLECGEPPGVVPLALVKTAKRLGFLVGSCSDRPIAYQQALWGALGIAVDFTVLKHGLDELRTRFAATAYYHVGDTETDFRYARDAGFRFLKADAAAHAAWAVELFGASG